MKGQRRHLVACVLISIAGCGAEPPPQAAEQAVDEARLDQYRADLYRVARAKARAWLDVLEVDAVELNEHGVKGKKKVGEILEAYLHYLNATDDPAEREAILRSVRHLARQTERPEYHDMATVSDRRFKQDSSSYFRVLTLLEQFGFDTTAYRAEVYAIQPRLDDHLFDRGPAQLAMFRMYYVQFGLDLPQMLADLPEATGIVGQRLSADQLSLGETYRLTQQVNVAFEYGLRKTQDHFSPEDVAYLETVLPALLRKARTGDRADLVALLVSCMTYLGLHDDIEYRAAVDELLLQQNPDGTWGDYELSRPTFGDYVDQHQYLNTTTVVMRALIEIFESDWNVPQ